MAGRRTLSHRIQTPENANPDAVRAFITQESEPETSPKNPEVAVCSLPRSSAPFPVGLIPITVRLSPEIAGALKRVSLERQLARAEYFSQQEIVERALAAWLREIGNLSS
jgi:hypothetical protein